MYATCADLLKRYDRSDIADLSTDDRETQEYEKLEQNDKILTALEDASARVNVALLVGGRYTVDQLNNLTGDSEIYLKTIVCSLAIAALFDRRGEAGDSDRIKRMTESGKEGIKLLQQGINILGLPEIIDAGRVKSTGPTAVDIRTKNDLAARMSRYFPDTAQRLPRDR